MDSVEAHLLETLPLFKNMQHIYCCAVCEILKICLSNFANTSYSECKINRPEKLLLSKDRKACSDKKSLNLATNLEFVFSLMCVFGFAAFLLDVSSESRGIASPVAWGPPMLISFWLARYAVRSVDGIQQIT